METFTLKVLRLTDAREETVVFERTHTKTFPISILFPLRHGRYDVLFKAEQISYLKNQILDIELRNNLKF